MSNQVTPFEAARQPETLQSLLRQDAYRKRFEQVLSDRAPQFISSILSLGATMPDVEPRSILASAAIAASLNLPIDKNLGFAWIIPYRKGDRKLASYQMGYKGYIQLALRTSQYARMNAKTVNAEALNGYDNVGEPVIDWTKLDETKPVVGYVFAFRLVNGFTKTAFWTKSKVEAHAKRYSQSYRGGYDSPWKSDFDAMALKTVISNELRHWGILSVEMQSALVEDQGVHVDVDSEVIYPEPGDDISRPKFETTAEPKAEEKELAAQGLAPAQAPEQPAKRGRPKKTDVAKQTQSSATPESPPTQPAPQPAAASPAAAGTAAQVESAPARADLFESDAYKQLRTCMTQSGITDAELILLCRQRGLMTEQHVELLQLSDAALTDLVDLWTTVAGQIRVERRKAQTK